MNLNPVSTVAAVLILLALSIAAAYAVTPDLLLISSMAALPPIVATVGFGHSPNAYKQENGRPAAVMPRAMMANHTFELNDAGELLHSVDGVLRATVAPSDMREYAELWPDCAPLVKGALPGAARRVGAAHVVGAEEEAPRKSGTDADLMKSDSRAADAAASIASGKKKKKH